MSMRFVETRLFRTRVETLSPTESQVIHTVLAVNRVILIFDIIDTGCWYLGEHDVIGYEAMAVRN